MRNRGDEEDPDRRPLLHADSLRRWYWAPVAVFVLGMLSLAILLWIYHFNDTLRMEINISNTIEEIQIKTATSHLWLEQAIAGDDTVDLWKVKEDIDLAESQIAIILEGGLSEYGLTLHPIGDQDLRVKAEIIRDMLVEYKRIADQRIRDPQVAKTGSSLDRGFDVLYRTIQARLEDLKDIIERKQIRDQINWRFYFKIILIAWIFVILISITGLWRQEVRRKAIAAALQRTNEALLARTEELKEHEEHLQELVNQRTVELTTANQTLRQENAERRKAEESLLASESRFRSLVEYIPFSISLKDRDAVYRYCNHACARDLEIEPQEVFGKTDNDFFPPELAEVYIAEDRRIIDSGEAVETTERYHRNGREVVIHKMKLPITYGGNGNAADSLLSISQDITEKTRMESIAEAANMMENTGYVFAGVRHELGNPVNSIRITLRLLLSILDTGPAATIREYVERALAETEKMEYLLRTLKNFNMYENLEPQDVQMQTFLERFLPLVVGDFEKRGILIRSNVLPEAISVMADPRALQQVMLNIMSNAADALEGREKPEIVIEASKINGFVRIQVRDNGGGMSEEQMQELFKPFHTTKPGGTGLGLVIAKKMLAGMKGDITVHSQKGTGTTVEITLAGGGEGGKR